MRKFIKWAIAVQVVGLAFLTASAQLPNCPLRPDPGTVVLDPLSLSSQNGSLQLAITERSGVDAAGFTHYCFDYATSNGDVESPTLRLNPGDTLTMDFTNDLHVTPGAVALPRIPPMKGMEHMAGSASTDPCKNTFMNILPSPCGMQLHCPSRSHSPA